MKRVGVLALQGDFEAHGRTLAQAGAVPVQVRTAEELDDLDGLILPGGESTTMLKLLRRQKLFEPLREFGRSRPIFGTCAGIILLANEVSHPRQESLGLMDLLVERNAYGRQINSAVGMIQPTKDFERRIGPGEMEAVFIRAPIVRRIGTEVNVLAGFRGDPVLVEDKMHLGATFHPELSKDVRVHQLFLSKL